MRRARRILLAMAAATVSTGVAGCWCRLVEPAPTEYELSASFVGPTGPIADVDVDVFFEFSLNGLEVVQAERTDNFGKLETSVFTYNWGVCSMGGMPRPPPPVRVTFTFRGNRWTKTLSVPIEESLVIPDEGLLGRIDIGEIAFDPSLPSLCGRSGDPPTFRQTVPAVEQLVGTYHLARTLHAHNLMIRVDGTFTWDHFDCDSEAAQGGRIEVTEEATLLAVDGGFRGFPEQFPYGDWAVPDVADVEKVRVMLDEDGGLITVGAIVKCR